jgi:hypothetical protein
MESINLDEPDTAAVTALLIKAVRLQDGLVRDQKLLEEIKQRVDVSRERIGKIRGALAIFGFDTSGDAKTWEQLKNTIGSDAYRAAVAAARGQHGSVDRTYEQKQPPQEDGNGGSGETCPQNLESGSSPDGSHAEKSVPKISDAILEYLQMRGREGARVSDIKEHLRKTYGVEMHEKTPGMTLFRLQKQDRVFRDGRTWFFVTPEGEAENPGAGAPGLFE